MVTVIKRKKISVKKVVIFRWKEQDMFYFVCGYMVLDNKSTVVLRFFGTFKDTKVLENKSMDYLELQGFLGVQGNVFWQKEYKVRQGVVNDDTAVAQRAWRTKSNREEKTIRTVGKGAGKGIQEYGWKIKSVCSVQGFWAEDTTMSTYLVNRSPSSAIGFKTPVDMLGFFFGWLTSIKQGMLELVKVVLYRNMVFNESGEYKKTFIGSGVGTGSMQVLQGDEFKEVQTQDLIYYHPARDREQHSAWEIFSYREDSNEAAFAVAIVETIYAHESLTFNDTVACEVISKWKAGLKDDMDARSDVYVLSNGCKKCSDDSDGYYWESTPVGSQEYQMVCTRLDIASADVGMLDKFDRGLQTDVQVFVDFDYAMGRSITSCDDIKAHSMSSTNGCLSNHTISTSNSENLLTTSSQDLVADVVDSESFAYKRE
ncbi:hypothetical protein Tco_0598167 [Tanacetum coccineum]